METLNTMGTSISKPAETPVDNTTSATEEIQPSVAEETSESVETWLQALGAFLIYTATWCAILIDFHIKLTVFPI